MELNGYTVDVCHDGEAGLDNALTSIYDVILLDVMLPDEDGLTIVKKLQRGRGHQAPARADGDGQNVRAGQGEGP